MKKYLVLALITLLVASAIGFTISKAKKPSVPSGIQLKDSNQTSIFQDPDWYIWGADVIKINDQYFMFYSRWPKETAMAGWLTHSEIALATSNNPAGPFEFKETVLSGTATDVWDGGMVHSPQVLEFEDKYYLYYTGVPQIPENLEDAEARQYLKDYRRLGVAVAATPEGPWERFNEPLIQTASAGDLDSLATANPAILEKPDGGFLLVYKGIKQEASEQRISLLAATSSNPLGPFKILRTPLLNNNVHVEDPDIWMQDGSYFMIAHDVTGHYSKASDGRSLALFSSPDGLTWQATPQPLASRRRVTWADGSKTYFQRFERPHVLVEDGKATMLYVAVKEVEGLAYNVAIPVHLE